MKKICAFIAAFIMLGIFAEHVLAVNSGGIVNMSDAASDAVSLSLEKKGIEGKGISSEILQKYMVDRGNTGETIEFKKDGVDPTLHITEFLLPSIEGFERTGVKVCGIERINMADRDEVKKAVDEYGGVIISYCSTGGYEDVENAAYNSGKTQSDINRHAVITGYDDEFKPEQFKNVPQGGGAWIVKDSAFKGGFGYVSYYDGSICGEGIAVDCDIVNTDKERFYQHDGGYSYDKDISFDNKGYICNTFVAEKDEIIDEVSFFIRVEKPVNYKVMICMYQTERNEPDSYFIRREKKSDDEEEQIFEITGVANKSGYYTAKLDQVIPVNEGERFTAYIQFESEGKVFLPVDTDAELKDAKGDVLAVSAVKSNDMESYVSEDGISWDSVGLFGDKNGRIKVRVVDAPKPEGYAKFLVVLVLTVAAYGVYFMYLKKQ